MKFEASKAAALNRLNNFVKKNLSEYSKLRNFDFGPENRTNISGLSPYITHGVINEKEVIEKSLSKFSFSKNEKFIQEVLWRTYWKGCCLLYTSPSPRDLSTSRMPSSA